ncbi:MAG TPA: hypothetical protein VKS01_10865 [Bryobacteraceae bacterium]|nr:hypothetical protein [Bryobacteraceae bacterium]
MDVKFTAAMGAYLVLAILAGFTLEGNLRIATWIFLGGIALKTFLVVLKRRQD